LLADELPLDPVDVELESELLPQAARPTPTASTARPDANGVKFLRFIVSSS
jgi:hypothetical protein